MVDDLIIKDEVDVYAIQYPSFSKVPTIIPLVKKGQVAGEEVA